MKTMRYLTMAALAFVGAMMTGCSSDDNIDNPQQPENKSNVVTLTTTVGLEESGATTRSLTSSGVKTFAVDDQIAVIYKNTSNQTVKAVSNKLISTDISADGKTANFTVTLSNPKASEPVRYIYPAAMAAATVDAGSDVDADDNVNYDALATQDGTLATLASTLDLAIFDGSLTAGAELPASATLENKLAILAITLKNNAATPTEITSSITGMTIYIDPCTYTVTRSVAAGPIYVAILPATDTFAKISATDGTTNYTKSLTGKTYAANNGYSVSWRMLTYPIALSAVTSANVGSVITSDGNVYPAMTAVPAGKTAVGILGKVTTTGHGLILALQDATSQTWNTINGWTSVTTYAGTTLKLLPDAARGSNLTSYTTLGSTPVSNWCVAQKSDYNAIFTNLGSKMSDGDGTTYDANVNAYITTGVGGTEISGKYWSATEAVDLRGWAFYSEYWSYPSKTNSRSVRPVLAF